MGNAIFDSITSKLATQAPMFAKVLVTQGLESVGADPDSVTPYLMKKALDEYILPRLHAYGKGFEPIDCIGEGIIRTGPGDEILEISPAILYFLNLRKKPGLTPAELKDALRQSGILHRPEEPRDLHRKCTSRKLQLPPPNQRTLEVLIAPMLNPARELEEVRYIVRDVTLSEGLLQEILELNKNLEKRIDERTEALQETERLGSLLVRELDRQRVLDLITEKAAHLVGAESVFVTMVSPDGQSYHYPAAYGLDAEKIIGGELPMEIGLCGWVLQHERPILIDNMEKDSRVVVGGVLDRKIKSAIYLPLFKQGQIVGGLAALGKKEGPGFSEEDMKLLSIFASHASIAIENAALYSEIKRNKEFLETIFNGVGVGITVLDPNMKIVTANQAIQIMSGHDVAHLQGAHCYKLFHGFTSPCADCPAQKTLLTEQPAQGSSKGRDRKGQDIYVKLNTYPVLNAAGEMTQIIEMAEDVTEIKRLERERLEHTMKLRKLSSDLELKVRERTRELDRKNSELEAANRTLKELDHKKTEFLNIVAHDLRTPLTSIISYADLLLRYKDEPREKRDEFLNIIKLEGLRLGNLVSDYLDISKIEVGLLDLSEEPVSLHGLIENCGAIFEGQREGKQINFRMEMDPEADQVIRGDRERLIQALVNLLSNAFKFTQKGGTITIRAQRFSRGDLSAIRLPDYVPPMTEGEDMAMIRVSNTGPHIPDAYHKEIFEKFKQVPQDAPESERGTGLGLPIAKSIIERHGGRLWVESRPGAGATFIALLPLVSRPSKIPHEYP